MGIEIDGLWAGNYYPQQPENLEIYNSSIDDELKKDQHLRSMEEILDYQIEAVGDDDFGAISDLIFEESTWAIRYIVIDTHKFWPGGKKILFSPAWVEKFDSNAKKLVTDFHHKVIESCLEYNPDLPIEDSIEDSFFTYFGGSGNGKSKGMDYTSRHLK